MSAFGGNADINGLLASANSVEVDPKADVAARLYGVDQLATRRIISWPSCTARQAALPRFSFINDKTLSWPGETKCFRPDQTLVR